MTPDVHQRSPRTVEELLRLPEDDARHELMGGAHAVTPSPALKHQRIVRRLAFELSSFFENHPELDAEVLFAPVDVRLSPRDLVVPDLLVVLEEHRQILTEKRVEGPPDLIVEVASPSTLQRDLTAKRELYERCGVREYWIVLPDEKVLLQHVRGCRGRYGNARRLRESVPIAIAPGARIELSKLW